MTEASLIEFLSEQEEDELNKLENEVISLSNNVLESARRAGEVLSIIKEKKYFTKSRRGKPTPVFDDFADYAKYTFGKGKTMSYNYVAVFNVMKSMEDEGLDPMMLGSIQNALAVHHELKRLTRVNKDLNPLFRQILHKGITVVENICPIDMVTGELLVTPEAISAAFETIGQVAKSGYYEIEGHQIPIELGQVALDDQASKEMYEAIQQRRLLAADDTKQKRTRMFEPKPGIQSFVPIKLDDVRQVHVLCPQHGTTQSKALLNGGLLLVCECRALMQIVENESMLVWYDKQ